MAQPSRRKKYIKKLHKGIDRFIIKVTQKEETPEAIKLYSTDLIELAGLTKSAFYNLTPYAHLRMEYGKAVEYKQNKGQIKVYINEWVEARDLDIDTEADNDG